MAAKSNSLAKNRISSDELEAIVKLVNSVCPGCSIHIRRDAAMVFVPPGMPGKPGAKNKNLLTLRPNTRMMRIMFPKKSPKEEPYDHDMHEVYRARLIGMLNFLTQHNG